MNTLSSMLKFLGDTLGANPNTLKTTDKTLVGGINGAWEIVYPVGSYYETSDASFDPNVSWGGTWSLEDAGKVHIGAGTGYTIGATGGSKDAIVVSHTHSVTGGSHRHKEDTNNVMYVGGQLRGANGSYYGWASGNTAYTGYDGGHSHTVSTVGSSGTNANMPPYVVINRWHRTA